MSDLFRRLFEDGENSSLSYAESRSLAAHEDVAVRRRLAKRTDLRPEVLYYLAEDTDPEVRRNIADNVSTPAKAYALLTADSDLDVRLTLAQRIATLAPELPEHEKDRVRQQVYEALAQLARDQIPKVRQLLSETLKDFADAPATVINRLARDVEIAVAAPVLTFSPVLTDEDLLDIIHNRPGTDRLTAIARRRPALNPPVTDALAATEDTAAIADMLSNRGAQIREETLDALVERASTVPEWHEPLVRRPVLRGETARRLAVFISDTLVEALMLRQDLPPEDAVAVAEEARRRLEAGQRDQDALIDYGPDWREHLRKTHARLVEQIQSGSTGKQRLRTFIADNDKVEAIALLAAMAGIEPLAVAGSVRVASPKGIVSIAWKAGLSAEMAVELQRWLGGIPPQDLLNPTDDGGYRMDEAEMTWQVEMFCETET